MPVLVFLAAVAIRGTQALLDATPYLLIGSVLAGAASIGLHPERTRSLFASPLRGPLLAAALAVLLPVCSIGALPLLTVLHRRGMPARAWLTLALAAGILHPFSLTYGLTLLDPATLALFALTALAPAVAAAVLLPATPTPAAQPLPPPSILAGGRRVAAIAWFGACELAGPALPWIALAALGAGLIGAIVPHGSLDMTILADDPAAPLRMLGIAPPAHVTPERAMMLTSQIFKHTCSAGAAYLLFALGAGANLGLIGLTIAALGRRHAVRPLLATAALALLIAAGFHAFVHLPGIDYGDTHAFDRMANPFSSTSDLRSLRFIIAKELEPLPIGPLTVTAALLAIGLTARHQPIRRRVEAALSTAPPAPASPGLWSRALPPRAVALVTLALALVAATALVFVYFPAPDETFDDMRIVRADALAALYSQSNPTALQSLQTWETLNRKLVVGTLLRHGPLPESQRLASRALSDSLDKLRQAVAAGAPLDQTRRLALAVEDSYAQLRRAYQRP
ncbi:MAG: permease [Isosphaeraceae bacterium]|jgi:uncharacterized membrane protein YraQ (UPF0718 family)|nr:MAG: permease [Isosphaeraceae bacterium]